MRTPVAIGFYPHDPSELRMLVERLLDQKVRKRKAIAAIVPHAGYEYSGKIAGATYAAIKTEHRIFCIACPNHTGLGKDVALSLQDWETPLGIVRNARLFANEIPVDESAHRYEHSLEVQLPFLQVKFGSFKLVPLCLSRVSFDELEELAEKVTREDLFYIASSDFTHFGSNYAYLPFFSPRLEENVKRVKELDMKAIEFIKRLDARGFYEHVVKSGLTICGFVPITLILLVAKRLGAKRATLIKYGSSFEVYPNESFVTYAGIIIS